MNDKVSILMATYNGEKYIAEQMNSILNQTYKNWELLIHDDGSLDQTVKIIKEYSLKDPIRIKLIDDTIELKSAKENFSYLMKFASSDYIMFCDQDDIWLEEKIELTLKKMKVVEKENPSLPVLIHSDLKVVNSDLSIIANSMFDYQKLNYKNALDIYRLSLDNCITGCTVMINKYLQNIQIPTEAIMHDWWIGLVCLKNNGIIYFIDKPLILYRQHGSNAIGSQKINFWHYFKKFKNLKTVFQKFQQVYKQVDKLGIQINPLKFMSLKLILIIKKI
jgi:glycosyltransferase involved in cell wall biosynthesis